MSQLATGGAPILDGRRQPSFGGTSRMTRECQVRICERLGVKLPGPTRQRCSKRRDNIPSGRVRRGERKQTADDVSKFHRRCRNWGCDFLPGRVRGLSWRRPERHPACKRREAGSGSCTERENLSPRCKGRRPSGRNRKDQSTDAGHRGGVAHSRVEGSVMEPDRRGSVVQPWPRANW